MSWLIGFVRWSPLASILAFSFVITAALSFLYKKLINQKEFEALKEKQKELRERMKKFKDDKKRMMEIQREMLQCSAQSMKMTFKPMAITFIPLLLTFYGLKKLYVDLAGTENIISWPWNLPIVGNGGGWLFCYIVFGFIFSLILRKIFKIG